MAEKWKVFDDSAVPKERAEKLAEQYRKWYPAYEFRVVPSDFHDPCFHMIEGRKKEKVDDADH